MFLAEPRIVQVELFPYIWDLARCEYFLFPKQEIHFDSEDIKRNTIGKLETITNDKFQRCFDQWKTC